jgi:hypothetical protein
MTRPTQKADALVIFGATGDLTKLETQAEGARCRLD